MLRGDMLRLLIGATLIAARIYTYTTQYPMDSSEMIVLVNVVSLALGGALTGFGAHAMWPTRFRKTATRVVAMATLLVAGVYALTTMELRAMQKMDEGRLAEAKAALEKDKLSERLGLRWAIQALQEKERVEGQAKLDRERESLEKALRAGREQLRLTNLRRQEGNPSIRGKMVILMQEGHDAPFVAASDDAASASAPDRVLKTRRGAYIPNLFDRLPDELRAKSVDEIETIALLRVSEEQTGIYVKPGKSWPSGGGIVGETPTEVFGYVVIYRLELIDKLQGAIIAERTFRGSPAPMKEEVLDGWAGKLVGAAPDDKVLEFLEGLPHGQAGKSRETEAARIGASYGGEWRGVARDGSGPEFRISFKVNAGGRMEGLSVYVGALCCGYVFEPVQDVEIRGRKFEARVKATMSPYYEGVVRGSFDSQRLASGRVEVQAPHHIDCGGGSSTSLSNGYSQEWQGMRKEWRFPLEKEIGRAGCK